MDTETLDSDDDAPREKPSHDAPEAPPGFVLLGEVGRGGMGAVWRARDLALDREVAVKLLQERYEPGSAAAARFVEEARITGQLQHPGIPAVYQVGTLPNGCPYLAMKLIKGDTLHALLNAGAALDPLSVFEAIAQAVGYAHARGVIHRDLKPANVMVGGFGEVQVMDWGLAKVLTRPAGQGQGPADDPEATTARTRIRSPRASDSDQTQDGSVLGTPAYMAPEQAAGEIDKVDARSDVFGLGAILCVLLTGRPPYGGSDFHGVHRAAMRGRTAEAFDRLDSCGADPDVVALCKRCLAFEQADRPESGNAVAEAVAHLRRAADDRARQAERDKHAADVRAAEQVKRRRAVQWAAGALVGVLLLGMVGTGLGLYRAETARRDAVKAERTAESKRAEAETARRDAVKAEHATELKRAEAEAARKEEAKQKALAQAKEAEANAVVKFFEDHVFAAGRPKGQEGGRGGDVSLHDAILAGLPALDLAFPEQPLVEARLRRSLGNTFYYLGEDDRAAEQWEQARALYKEHAGPDHPETLTSMTNLANAYARMNRQDEALKLRKDTLAAQKKVLPPDHPDTLLSMNNLAVTYDAIGRHDDARKLLEAALAAKKRVLPPDHPDVLLSMTNLANSYSSLKRHDEALKLREETLAAQKKVLPPDHPDTLQSMNNLAASFSEMGRHAEALKLIEETLAARRRVLPLDHPETLSCMNNLANAYARVNRQAEALKLREETLAAQKRVLPPDHPDTLLSMNNLAISLEIMGRHDEALKLREEALAAQKRVLPPDHPETLASMTNLANSYARAHRLAEALKLREATLAAVRRVFPPDHPETLTSMNNLANSFDDLGRHTEALKLHEEVLAGRKRVLPPDHVDTLSSMHNVANGYQRLKRDDDALRLRAETLAAMKRVLPPDHPGTLGAQTNLAVSLRGLDREAEALPLLEDSFRRKLEVLPANHQFLFVAADQLARCYLALDRSGDAVATADRYLQHAAGKKGVAPRWISQMLVDRNAHFVKIGDPDGCRATAAMWERQLNPADASGLYNAACIRAIASAVQTKAGGDDTDRHAGDDADRAMTWLAKAVAAGFKDRAKMENDADLDALRERDDFKALMAELETRTVETPASP